MGVGFSGLLGAVCWAWVVPGAVSPVLLVLGGRGWDVSSVECGEVSLTADQQV